VNVSFDFNFWTMLLFVLNFGLAIFVSVSNRSKAANDELKAMKNELQKDIKDSRDSISSRISDHAERLSRIESDIENAIDGDDIKNIHKRVDEILANSKEMEGQLKIMNQNFQQFNNFMMSGGKHG
jgi:predicted  nucleic acid-binding Zn-ribbon protein